EALEGFHEPVRSAGLAGFARHRGPCDRCRDQARGREMRLSGHHGQVAGIYSGTFSAYLRDVLGIRDRHVETADSSRAGGALSVRWNQDGRERRDEFARAICDWRSRVHWIAWGEPRGSVICTGAKAIKTENFVA